jgi:hypothetical protein
LKARLLVRRGPWHAHTIALLSSHPGEVLAKAMGALGTDAGKADLAYTSPILIRIH